MLNPADPAFEAVLPDILLASAFRDAAVYVTEPRGEWRGQGIVVAPTTTAQVVAVVKTCVDAHVGILPYGGGTGLVGGQTMHEEPTPLILSLDRMTKIHDVYPTENVLICEAGTILVDVQQAAADNDRLFPMSLATNAGWVNVLRYGNMRAQCLGLEVVRPDGTIWNGLSRLRKDNPDMICAI